VNSRVSSVVSESDVYRKSRGRRMDFAAAKGV